VGGEGERWGGGVEWSGVEWSGEWDGVIEGAGWAGERGVEGEGLMVWRWGRGKGREGGKGSGS